MDKSHGEEKVAKFSELSLAKVAAGKQLLQPITSLVLITNFDYITELYSGTN
jgi:hypothetical protein